MLSKRKPRNNTTDLRKLFSFQMRRFHLLYTRTSALIYSNRFGLTNNEARMVAELIPFMGEEVPLSRLVAETSFDNAVATRVIDGLIAKGVVTRTADAKDSRARKVAFTEHGRRVGNDVRALLLNRNERLMAHLTAAEQASLSQAMEKLIAEAAILLQEERERHAAAKAGSSD